MKALKVFLASVLAFAMIFTGIIYVSGEVSKKTYLEELHDAVGFFFEPTTLSPAMIEQAFTTASFAALKSEHTQAGSVLSNSSSTEPQLTQATNELTLAVMGLDHLEEFDTNTHTVVKDYYETRLAGGLYASAAVTAAEEFYNKTEYMGGGPTVTYTQEQINQCLLDTVGALAEGRPAPADGFDFTALEAIFDEASLINNEDYSFASASRYGSQVETCVMILYVFDEDTIALLGGQQYIDDTVAALRTAIDNLVNITALTALLTDAKSRVPADYTAESFNAMDSIVDSAIELLEGDPTQAEVDDMIQDLQSAIDNLQPVDIKADLRALLDDADIKAAYDSNNVIGGSFPLYSANTFAAFKQAYDGAKDVLDDAGATQTDVDDAYDAVSNSFAALVDLSDIWAAVSESGIPGGGLYTGPAQDALTDARTAAISLAMSAAPTQTQVDEAAAAIRTAFGNLTDISGLQALLDEHAPKLQQSSKYTEISFGAFVSAYNAAEALMETIPTPQQVSDAISNLTQAAGALEEVPPVDKTALQAAINTWEPAIADAFAPYFSKASFAALQAAVYAGKTTLEDAEATQEDVDAATNLVTSAGNDRVIIGELRQAIDEAETIMLESDKYTAESVTRLAGALLDAETMVDSTEAYTQDDVNDVLGALNFAIENMVEDDGTLNWEPLNSALSEPVNAEDYTNASLIRYTVACIDGLNLTFANPDEVTQQMINDAAAAIRTAIDNLVSVVDLNDALTEATSKTPSDYTPASYSVLNNAVNDGIDLKEGDPTQTQVDDAEDAIRNAIAALQLRANFANLLDAIDDGKAVTAADYSTASYGRLTSAISDGELVAANLNATQTQVDGAETAIRTAITNLVNISALNTALADAATKVETDYTPDSYAVLDSAVDAANTLLAGDPTASDVTAATTAITDAIAALQTRANFANLLDAIDDGKAVTAADYSTASYGRLTSAISAGELVAANLNATQTQVDDAETAIRTAITNLVNISALNDALNAAAAIVEADYTADSYAVLDSAVDAANTLLAGDPNASDVTAATTAITDAIAALQASADFTDLLDAIDDGKAVTAADYSTASYGRLTSAISAGELVAADLNSTQTQVDDAETAIRTAITNLVNISALNDALTAAAAIVEANYTPASYAVLDSAVDAANTLLAGDPNATQVVSATTAITDAIAALVAVPNVVDKSGLIAAVLAGEAIDSQLYTVGSYAVLAEAIADGILVRDDSGATQTEVDDAVTAITNAIADLADFIPPSDYDVIKIQESDSHLIYSGSWGLRAQIGKFDGHIANASSQTGASVTFTFKGTGFSFISYSSYSQGTFDVYIDGVKASQIDGAKPIAGPLGISLYTPGADASFQKVAYRNLFLEDKVHTVTIILTGREPQSIGSNVYVDAIEVTGILDGFTVSNLVDDDVMIVENSSSRTIDVLANDNVDDNAVITAVGQPESGTVTIVDGNKLQYTPNRLAAFEDDEFTYTVNGETATVSLIFGEEITYQENFTSNDLVFSNIDSDTTHKWSDYYLVAYWNSFAKRSSQVGDTVKITFFGTGIDIIGYKSRSRGLFEVSWDGGVPATTTESCYDGSYDAYYRTPVYSVDGLTAGWHTVTIKVLGDREPNAIGTAIDIDAITIHR